jgi:hypothetical protein
VSTLFWVACAAVLVAYGLAIRLFFVGCAMLVRRRVRGGAFRVLASHSASGMLSFVFIDATADYITNMIKGAKKPNFLDEPLEQFAGNALHHSVVSLFEPYRDVHEFNKAGVLPVWGL